MLHTARKPLALLLALLLLFALAGCEKTPSSGEPEPEAEEPVYPVSVKGTEIIVGQTKVQALLDAGFEVTWSEMDANNQITEHVVDAAEMLEPMSFYTGASIWINEHVFAHIAFATDEEAVALGKATVAWLEICFSYDEEANREADVVFNGVPAMELTREKAGEVFPDFTGDDNMWFSTGLRNYEYGVYYANGTLNKITVERKYDVDWNS